MKDLIAFGEKADLKKSQVKKIVEQIIDVVSKWENYSRKTNVFEKHLEEIKRYLRLELKEE